MVHFLPRPRRCNFAIFILLAGVMVIAAAPPPPDSPPGWIPSGDNLASTSQQVTLLESTAQDLSLLIDLPGLRAETVQTSLGAYTHLSGEGFGRTASPGSPDLPVVRREVEIPWGAQVSLELISAKYREVSLAALGLRERVQPRQPSTPKCGAAPGPIGCDESIYSTDAYFPSSPVRLGGESDLRDHRILTIEIYPALYQPVAGRLRLYSSIELRLRFNLSGLQAVNPPKNKPASAVFESILAERLVNYTPASATTIQPQYLIISADLFESHLAPFIALKERQGFAVSLATLSETGSTKEQIKTFIKERYDGSTPPDYLLLVGDDNFIPAWPASKRYGGPTDLYYATMGTSPDYIPDIFYGRLPMRNSFDLDAWIGKMLDYEHTSGNEDWVKGASFLATDSQELVPGTLDLAYKVVEDAHNFVIEQVTASFGYLGNFPNPDQAGGDKLYAWSYKPSHQNVVEAINAGRALVVYSGYGSGTAWLLPEFNQTDVREMTGSPVTLSIGLACNTADFSYVESVADTWITQANSGALAYIGSSNTTNWEEDSEIEVRMFNNLFSQDAVTAGLAAALEDSLQYISGSSSFASGYPEIYQLFGDPSLQLIRQPRPVDFSIDVAPAHIGTCSNGTAQASITVNGKYDFNNLVDLNISGLPAGLSAVFTPNPIMPATTAALTLNSLISPPGDFQLTITGSSGGLSRQSPLLFSIRRSLPSEVTLITPTPFTPNMPLRPTLTWIESPDALSYDLQIASDHLFSNRVVDVTGLTQPTYTLDFDLARGENYWWRVRAVNACGRSAFALPERFTTLPQPGTCDGNSRAAAYSMNFDANTTGWNFTSEGPWELSTTVSHSPDKSAFAWSNHTSGGQRSLISPSIPVPDVDSPVELTFWSKHVFENTLECRDGGLLDISLNNGVSWSPISPESITAIPYDDLISSAHRNPLGNQFGWCGTRDWSKVVVSLDEYSGKSIKLRWHLGFDDSSGEGVGWHVDDVAVESCVYNPPPGVQFAPMDSQITGLAGQNVRHTLELTNTGPGAATFVLSTSSGTWSANTVPVEIWLADNSSAQVAVDVSIPAAAAPGSNDQTVLYAFGKDDRAVHAQANLTTHVSPYRIELSTAQPLKTGLPGMGVIFEVQVMNTGISACTIDLSFVPPVGWTVGPLESPIILAVGASKTILATVFVPADALPGTLADFMLEAVSHENPEVKAQLPLQVQVTDPIPLYLPIVMR